MSDEFLPGGGPDWDAVEAFGRRFGGDHLALAMHAAIPLGLTPELVHLIRVNFTPSTPAQAEADLLLSPLCRDDGAGQYQMPPGVRELLQAELIADPEFGPISLEKVARFLLGYIDREFPTAGPDTRRTFLASLEWAGYADLDPKACAEGLQAAITAGVKGGDRGETLRVARLTRSLGAPLAGERTALVVAAVVDDHLSGRVGAARDRLRALAPADGSDLRETLDRLFGGPDHSVQFEPLPVDLLRPSFPLRTMYISYQYSESGDHVREVVPVLETATGHPSRVVWDDQLNTAGPVSEFVNRPGTIPVLVAVLGPKYLQSRYCLEELYTAWESSSCRWETFQTRVLSLILSDARIDDEEIRYNYSQYWMDQAQKLWARGKVIGEAGARRANRMKTWGLWLADALDHLNDPKLPRGWDHIRKDGFAIIRQVLEERFRRLGVSGDVSDRSDPHRTRLAGEKVTLTLPGGVPMVLAWCPPGSFLMGSEYSTVVSVERPVHRVTLTRGFYAGIYPVTQAQWKAVMGTDPSYFKGPNRPVERVSWNDCQAFCQKLTSLQSGRGTVRLPSEAEWEYACRAGTTTEYHFGDQITTDLANYDGNDTWKGSPKGVYLKQTTEVGLFSANAWGLFDMHGNVWEWCEDVYAPYPAGDQVDPVHSPIKSKDSLCVMRGGSWFCDPVFCRAAFRGWGIPAGYDYSYGFRVAFRLEDPRGG